MLFCPTFKSNLYQMIKKLMLLIFIGLSITSQAQQYPQNYFRSPLDIPLALSGTFGELRANHFHSGIDIKTQGVEGKNVYAVADGYVSRIKISPWGYGNAIYIAHPNGYTTVYGHLKNLSGDLAVYLKKKQYQRKNFEVDIYLDANTLPVKKGSLIALSGNSGGSGGPHLHFETRKTSNQQALNPMLFGFDIKDTRKPTIIGAYLYYLDEIHPARKEEKRTQLILKNNGNGNYSIAPFTASGKVAFGIHTIDKLNAAENKNGIYQLDQYVNDTLVFSFTTEKFLFKETRYINAHIDYELSKTMKRSINRCFVIQGNHLKMYPTKNGSTFTVKPNKKYNLKWVVSDISGNQSILTTTVTGVEKTNTGTENENYLNINQENYLSQDGAEIYLPKGALYLSEPMAIRKIDGKTAAFLATYKIGNETIGLQKRATIQIKIPENLKAKQDKLIGVYLKNGREPSNEGGTIVNGKIKFTSRYLGLFTLMIDSTAPAIKPIYGANGASYKTGNTFKFKATDDLSGIETYTANIDGRWVLLEYNPKKARFSHTLDKKTKPGKHSFEIKVTDERKNVKIYTFDFNML